MNLQLITYCTTCNWLERVVYTDRCNVFLCDVCYKKFANKIQPETKPIPKNEHKQQTIRNKVL